MTFLLAAKNGRLAELNSGNLFQCDAIQIVFDLRPRSVPTIRS